MAARPLIRSSRGRGNNSAQWIPDTLREALVRFVRRVFGLSLLTLASLYAIMLATYDPLDPSWNTALSHSSSVRNLLGTVGSSGADIIWQFFGMAGIIPAFILIAWGWRVFTLGVLEFVGWRVLATFIAMISVSITFGAIWPDASKLGAWNASGSLGDLLADGFRVLLPNLWGRFVIAFIMGCLGLATLYMGCSLTLSEWQNLLRLAHDGLQSFTNASLERFHQVFTFLRDRRSTLDDELDDEEDREEDKKPSFLARLFRKDAPEEPLVVRKRAVAPEDADEESEEDDGESDVESDEEVEDDAESEESDDDGDGEEESEEEEPEEKPRKGLFSKASAKKSKMAVVQRTTVVTKQGKLPFSDDIYPLPPLELLQSPDAARKGAFEISKDALAKNAKQLESVLADFGVFGQITKVSPGPVVTLYELEPSPGTRASRVISLADDIARNMSATSVRVAVVPGRNVIGIELPNKKREMVYLREVLASTNYREHAASLPLVLGKDISGAPIIADLARMPHLLIAGTTGSGKSVAVNTMILSLIYRLPPQKCRFIMIDPKMLELSMYDGIPHLLAPVVTEPKKAIMALKWTVREMEERYRAMSKLGVRNIEGYNIRLQQAAKNGENLMRKVQTGFDRETGKPIFEEQPLDLTPLPFIVVIVDEMADLMIVAGKEIEAAVQRLAQMARAAGIHIMMATQRPSVDVITGTIKANFPTRISFQVTSKIDSRTILGEQGAEQLLGQGDMLYMAGGGRVTRVHGPFVRDDEVESIVKFLKAQGEPEYLEEITEDAEEASGGGDAGSGGGDSGSNDLYDKAVDIVLRERKASISFIQRHLQIGYNRAATIIERMERDGIVGAANHVGKREIFGRKPDDE